MNFGPIEMSVQGDTFTEPARILAIVWEGATSAGNTIEIRCPKTNKLLWPGRTGDSHTYQGINLGTEGMAAPHGFKLSQIQSGRVLVYLREN